jgi:hypothetical protein
MFTHVRLECWVSVVLIVVVVLVVIVVDTLSVREPLLYYSAG